MTRVLNIISDTNIGGAGRVLINYMKYYDRQNYRVGIALPRGSQLAPILRELGADVIEVDGIADRSYDKSDVKKLRAVIDEYKPDIVHTHGALSGRIAAKRCGVTVIYTRHSAFPVKSYIKKGPGRLLNKIINEHYADRIIAISPAAAENLTDGGISPDLIEIMMNGVEPVERIGEEALRDFRNAHGIGEGDFTLGILARIEDYKGHMDILDAVKLLREEGRAVKLLVAGSGSYESAVRDRVHELGIDDAVIFLGFVSDVPPVLSAMDLQLNASWGTETSSLSILEGFSMGLPAVVSDYGGNPCLVDDGVNGFIFPQKNGAAMADCIRQVMDSEETRASLSRGARDIYLKRFTGEVFAARIEEIYTKTLALKRN